MTELESRLRTTLEAVAHDRDLVGPDAEDLLARARTARTTRHRTVMAGIAAVFVLVVPVALVLTVRGDNEGTPAVSPSPSTSRATTPAGWTEYEAHGLKLSMPPGTVVNPRICPRGGLPVLFTKGVACRSNGDPVFVPASISVWMYESKQLPPLVNPKILQTLNRDGLSGYVGPGWSDPGFAPKTPSPDYDWNLIENTTTTGITLGGNDPKVGQQVIDSLRLATR
ncbi:hypothetical protein [Kribbella catacumbae]|uniref:hypothetical protein n=1 Tax=Kribbella catacumbae TaxID=460086 RepID=UPI00035D8EAC|nr:hypothetical protein [Kribbella catacumbae]